MLGAIAEGKAGTAARRPPQRPMPPRRKAEAPKPAPQPAAKPRRAAKPTRPRCRRRGASRKKPALPPPSVAGTGKDGRVTKGDMLAALEARAAERRPSRSPVAAFRARAPMPRAKSACR